jgi:hypothetical protein
VEPDAVPEVTLASTPRATVAATQLLLSRYHQYSLLFGEPDDDQLVLSENNGFVELRRSFVTVLSGCHTGYLAVHVENHWRPPELDLDAWDEVVEFSVLLKDEDLQVHTYMEGPPAVPLPVLARAPGIYRVRLQARGRDASLQAEDDRLRDGVAREEHAVLAWPEEAGPLRILKTSDQVGRVNRIEKVKLERHPPDALVFPGQPLVGEEDDEPEGNPLRMLAPGLMDGLSCADDETLRAVARFAARQAVTEAGLTEYPWMREVLTAMDAGTPFPSFYESKAMWDWLLTTPGVPHTPVTEPPGGFAPPPAGLMQQACLMSPMQANEGEPLGAALRTVFTALITYGDNHEDFLYDVRQAFPDLEV